MNSLITKLLTTLTLASCISSTAVYAELVLEKEKVLVLNGVIAQGNIMSLGEEMIRRANEGQKEVQLIINSPGGEILTGTLFLNLMADAQNKGLKVTCAVPVVAASMAYHILLHCDERHVLSKGFLLWHRARVYVGGLMGQPMTGPQAESLGKSLLDTDNGIFRDLRRLMTGISTEDLRFHFENETLHQGTAVHVLDPEFVTPHKAIKGIFEFLKDQDVPRNKELDMSSLETGSIVYVSDIPWRTK